MKTQNMKVLTVGGKPRERGRAIGEALRGDIHIMLQKYQQTVAATRHLPPTKYFPAFDEYSEHLAAVEKWTPDLLEEVWGIAEGAGISKKQAFRLQLLDEDWFFNTFHCTKKSDILHKCTSFGVVGDNCLPTYAGQNMDIESYVEGHQLLLHIQYPDSDLESFVFTIPGLIGLCGMNNAPLGINCNTMIQMGCIPNGLPVSFVTRSLLEQNTYDDAVDFLHGVKIAAGQNYIISNQERVGAFECSPNKVVEFITHSDGLKVCHTNHPLQNDDTQSFENLVKADPNNNWIRGTVNSHSRLSSIRARVQNFQGTIGLDDLKIALAAKDDPSHPVCRELPKTSEKSVISYTAGSLIYELSAQPKIHIAAGPASLSEFLCFEFG